MPEVKVIHPIGGSVMVPRKVKHLPSKETIAAVVPGNSVRICICGEDFWVEVSEVSGDLIIGVVDSDLLMMAEHDLYKGDVIQFHHDSVFQIFVPEEKK